MGHKAWTVAYRIATADFPFEKLLACAVCEKEKRRIMMRLSLYCWGL